MLNNLFLWRIFPAIQTRMVVFHRFDYYQKCFPDRTLISFDLLQAFAEVTPNHFWFNPILQSICI